MHSLITELTSWTEGVQKKHWCILDEIKMKTEPTPHVTVATALNLLHHCIKRRFFKKCFVLEYRIANKC